MAGGETKDESADGIYLCLKCGGVRVDDMGGRDVYLRMVMRNGDGNVLNWREGTNKLQNPGLFTWTESLISFYLFHKTHIRSRCLPRPIFLVHCTLFCDRQVFISNRYVSAAVALANVSWRRRRHVWRLVKMISESISTNVRELWMLSITYSLPSMSLES